MRNIVASLTLAVCLLTHAVIFGDEAVSSTAAGTASVTGTATGSAPAASCPTSIVAQIPQGSNQAICVWHLTNCTTQQSGGTVNADCGGSLCECSNGTCVGSGPPIQLGRTFSAIPQDEIIGGGTRPRPININRVVPQRTIPLPTTLIPAAADSAIMPWGQGEWKVKYIKTLKLTETSSTPGDQQFYGLYKVFKSTAANPDGLLDVDTDQYVGFRVASEPAEPREIDPCSYNAIDRVQKYQTTTSGVRMEIGVKAAVSAQDVMGNSSTLQKWFHLYGVYR